MTAKKPPKAPPPKAQPSLDQQAALLRDRHYRAWLQQNSIRSWVDEAANLSHDAEREKLNPWQVYVFWIRLYGVLQELRGHWSAVVEKRKTWGLDASRWEELVASTDEAKRALSNDQRLLLEYRRHWVGHPILDSFRVKVNPKDGSILDTRTPSLAHGGPVSKDDYDRVLGEAVRDDDHKGNARDIARLVNPGLARVFELTMQLYPKVQLGVDVELL